MSQAIELVPEWVLTVYQSPLDEKPWVYLLDSWDELQEKIEELESSEDSFDINLCSIKRY